MRTATNHKTGKPFIFCFCRSAFSFFECKNIYPFGNLLLFSVNVLFRRSPFLVNGSCNEVISLSVALFCKTVYLF